MDLKNQLIRERYTTREDPRHICQKPKGMIDDEYYQIMQLPIEQLKEHSEAYAKQILERIQLNDKSIEIRNNLVFEPKHQELLKELKSSKISLQLSSEESLASIDDENVYLSPSSLSE